MRYLLFTFLLLLSSMTQANIKVADFAFKAEIVPSQEGIYRLELPINILLQLTREDLGDINVFDAEGNTLPSLVQKVPPQTKQQKTELPIFPFNQYSKQAAKVVTTRVQNQAPDQTSEVETTETLSSLKSNQIYIIEIPVKLHELTIDHIAIETQHAPADQLLILRIDVASDLDTWQTLHRKKTISPVTLTAAATNTIDQIPTGIKYLRLTPHNTLTEFKVTRATTQASQLQPTRYVWHPLDNSTEIKEGQQYYKIPVRHSVPNSLLRILPSKAERIIQGNLYGTPEGFEHKQLIRGNIQQHNYTSDQVNQSAPISIDMARYPVWWFAPQHNTHAPLTFEIGIPMYEIQFLGNKRPPFTLAWGRANHQPIHTLRGLLSADEEKTNFAKAALSTINVAGGEQKLHGVSDHSKRTTWILWASLVLAVLITGAMALNLLRDIKQDDDTSSL